MKAYGKVGKKGTLYPPKKLREKLQLKEGDMIQYTVKGNTLLIVKIPNPIRVASEFNIPFNTKKAINIINEVRKESEREIEEEIARAEILKDPIQLALSGKKFASITPKQVEAISLEEQTSHVKGSP